ncbi:HNH endonuclease [Plantibacter sp. M259]|uniref:HNH endonuclease n=1 Tax=Plantibacter sp. M259 TaxID=2583822 RepID=UPI00197B59B6|nr:HNH endonuclease signature motif containing protein [Plantibacter sp. M259]
MAEKRNTSKQNRFRARIKAARPACHICGDPIDWDADYLDPMSFVIDHVIPIHRGGADALSNIAAAHRLCNSKKRARLIAPIVRRSGSLG